MRFLLDTNIIIYREASYAPRRDVGVLFRWMDRLHYEKCIHPDTITEIRQHRDVSIVNVFEAKITNYQPLKTLAPENDEIRYLRAIYDKDQNDYTDTSMLNEVFSNRVSGLITEDRKIHLKAADLGISERIYTIDSFLEKVTAENPGLSEYKILSVQKEYFGNIDFNGGFFDSFRDEYAEFNNWFNKKSDEIAYICKSDLDEIVAFLYVKLEREDENYSDITPPMPPKKRLKIGTLKVISNGFKIGERFLKIILRVSVLLMHTG